MARTRVNRNLLRAGRVAVPLAMVVTLAAACGSSSSSTTGGSSASSGSSSSPMSAGASVETASGDLGTFLTDGAGRSLYLFASDTATTSTCSGACATAWPPLTTTGAPTASGDATTDQLGTLTRGDGAVQVTYGGHPLYYFAGDKAAGQTNGQGKNGFGALWWLVAPSGAEITGAGASAGATTSGY